MADAKASWRSIRGQRSQPPPLAAQDERRRLVFQAALTQAEELWDAATVAGAASRPLPLFYCLSQAGRAVCAAWLSSDPWEPGAHGLRRPETTDADQRSSEAEPGIRAFTYGARVTGGEAPAFSMIAEATRSERYEGMATVAELWASLPRLARLPPQVSGSRCIRLERVPPPATRGGTPLERAFDFAHGIFHLYGLERRYEALPEVYPTTRGLEQVDVVPELLPDAGHPVFTFPREDGTLRPLYEVGVVDPDDSRRRQYFVRPRIGANNAVEPPSEFLTLWALMFCLSELARYYPSTWVAALNPDSSVHAVTLEHGLDVALEEAPRLIDQALSGPMDALMHEEIRRVEAERAAEAETQDPGGHA
jgi:hypothetical protein